MRLRIDRIQPKQFTGKMKPDHFLATRAGVFTGLQAATANRIDSAKPIAVVEQVLACQEWADMHDTASDPEHILVGERYGKAKIT